MTTFGQDLVASTLGLLALAEDEAEPARVFTPPDIDVAAIGKRSGLFQARFVDDFARNTTQFATRKALRFERDRHRAASIIGHTPDLLRPR